MGGEGGGSSPALSRKMENSALMSLIAFIYGLNFLIKVQFFSFQEKKPEIFPCQTFLFRAVDDCLSKCPNSKKTPLP